MKANSAARPFLGVALVAAITLLCIYSMPKDIMSSTNGPSTTNEDVKVDFDFTRMNPTMQMTYTLSSWGKPKGVRRQDAADFWHFFDPCG